MKGEQRIAREQQELEDQLLHEEARSIHQKLVNRARKEKGNYE